MIDKISNTELYAQCHVLPASLQVMHARWCMIGHTLRMPADTPGSARKAMLYYFTKEVDIAGRQGNYNTIATALSKEYESDSSTKINYLNQFNKNC